MVMHHTCCLDTKHQASFYIHCLDRSVLGVESVSRFLVSRTIIMAFRSGRWPYLCYRQHTIIRSIMQVPTTHKSVETFKTCCWYAYPNAGSPVECNFWCFFKLNLKRGIDDGLTVCAAMYAYSIHTSRESIC